MASEHPKSASPDNLGPPPDESLTADGSAISGGPPTVPPTDPVALKKGRAIQETLAKGLFSGTSTLSRTPPSSNSPAGFSKPVNPDVRFGQDNQIEPGTVIGQGALSASQGVPGNAAFVQNVSLNKRVLDDTKLRHYKPSAQDENRGSDRGPSWSKYVFPDNPVLSDTGIEPEKRYTQDKHPRADQHPIRCKDVSSDKRVLSDTEINPKKPSTQDKHPGANKSPGTSRDGSQDKPVPSGKNLKPEKRSAQDKRPGADKFPGTSSSVATDMQNLNSTELQPEKSAQDKHPSSDKHPKDVSPDKQILGVTALQLGKPAQDKHPGANKHPSTSKDVVRDKQILGGTELQPEKPSAQHNHPGTSNGVSPDKRALTDKELHRDKPPGQDKYLDTEKTTEGVRFTIAPKSPVPEAFSPPMRAPADSAQLLNRLAQSVLSLMLDAPTRSQWNVLFSPMALAVSLTVLAAGSDGDARRELCQLLQMQLPQLEQLIDKFKVDGDAETTEHLFYVAHKLFLEADCPLLETFRHQIEAKYMTTAQNVDFKSPHYEFVRVINEWCGIATNGKVSAVVSPTTLPPDTSMVLVSAIFFKGLWRDRFSSNSTQQMQFH
ncbi:unnamed protein product, partial [Ixodes pacificus]